MKKSYLLAATLGLATLTFSACSDDESDILPGPPDYELTEQPTEGAFIMTLQGKVDDSMDGVCANMVYVDLSGERQQLVDRKSWHLGFYNGAEDRVTLNQSLSRVYTTGKTDIAAVSQADAEAESFPDIAGGMMSFPTDVAITDATNGSLDETAFGDLAVEEAKSEVFLLATEGLDKSAWFKLKITALPGAYLLEYAGINDTATKKVTLKKNPNHLFTGFSLESGKEVELPQKWDLMWSKSIALTTMPNGKKILGPSSDVVTTNRHGGVEVAVVSVNNPQQIAEEFEQFKKEDVENLEFHQDADVLGTDWRLTPMPNAIAPGPKTDRFYVLKNAEGKCFKVRFRHFCEEDGGERGKPMLEAAPLD